MEREVVDGIAGDRERRHHPRRGSQAGVSQGFGLQRASSLGLSTGTHELLPILSWAILLLGALVVAFGVIDYARSA
jgi:hypothetical protein